MKPASARQENFPRRISAQGEELKGAKAPLAEEVARQALNYAGVTTEMWAAELAPNKFGEFLEPRTIQKWRSGEVKIPEERCIEINFKAKEIISRQVQAIDSLINLWILQTYGPRARAS